MPAFWEERGFSCGFGEGRHLVFVLIQARRHRSTILDLIGFADSNYACDPEDRKSVMGFCYFTVVSWSSMKPAYNVSFHHLKMNL